MELSFELSRIGGKNLRQGLSDEAQKGCRNRELLLMKHRRKCHYNLEVYPSGPTKTRSQTEEQTKKFISTKFFRLICLSPMRCVIGKYTKSRGARTDGTRKEHLVAGSPPKFVRFINLLIRSLYRWGPLLIRFFGVRHDLLARLEFVVYVPKIRALVYSRGRKYE